MLEQHRLSVHRAGCDLAPARGAPLVRVVQRELVEIAIIEELPQLP